ncbi:hypothetical protein V6N13_088696 [Hibiscus sabdariffa]|uniref:Uncharacterized protein n=1 Tax=Hibiscus sabdariffa TaxID=183260 RepID=A0ABR2G0K3_9ROSI
MPTKNARWRFIHGEWVHKKDKDEARVAPAIVDATEGPPPMTIESTYETMTSRFDNIDAFLRTSHEESTTMIRSLDGHLTSLEQDIRDFQGSSFPTSIAFGCIR